MAVVYLHEQVVPLFLTTGETGEHKRAGSCQRKLEAALGDCEPTNEGNSHLVVILVLTTDSTEVAKYLLSNQGRTR